MTPLNSRAQPLLECRCTLNMHRVATMTSQKPQMDNFCSIDDDLRKLSGSPDDQYFRERQLFPPAPLIQGVPGEAKHARKKLLNHLLRNRYHQKCQAKEGFWSRILQEPTEVRRTFSTESEKLLIQVPVVIDYYGRKGLEVPDEQLQRLRKTLLQTIRLEEASE